MCFNKFTNTKIYHLKRDLYVAKKTLSNIIGNSFFISQHQNFTYDSNKIYKKSFVDKIKAFFNDEFEGEVFHTFPLQYSKTLLNSNWTSIGIFRIPKGTKIYVNEGIDLACFAIEYIAPMTDSNKHLITDQEDYV